MNHPPPFKGCMDKVLNSKQLCCGPPVEWMNHVLVSLLDILCLVSLHIAALMEIVAVAPFETPISGV